jgi:Ca2+-binding EF-hand superfamily protein
MFPGSTHRRVATLLLSAAAVLLVSAAIAQGVMVDARLLMDDDLLTMLDTDSHAILSSDEYSYYRQRLFDQTDANHDGSISAQEYADHAKDVFADMDADHDGVLTRDEINAAHTGMLRMMYKNPHTPNLDAIADAMLARMDADHDGKISAQEYADAMKIRFNALDSKQGGQVNKGEFFAVHRPHKADVADK